MFEQHGQVELRSAHTGSFFRSKYYSTTGAELVEPAGVEPQIGRADYEVTCGFSTVEGPYPNPHAFQGSAVFLLHSWHSEPLHGLSNLGIISWSTLIFVQFLYFITVTAEAQFCKDSFIQRNVA